MKADWKAAKGSLSNPLCNSFVYSLCYLPEERITAAVVFEAAAVGVATGGWPGRDPGAGAYLLAHLA